ncbi:MAG: hypothetical protein KGL43_23220 [Burkholderiales bacterium]|nr:hypothetical protein [Burkholderiales bacterium]MDE2456508.1 hypothetical protein [Burkholderiales bacterium]
MSGRTAARAARRRRAVAARRGLAFVALLAAAFSAAGQDAATLRNQFAAARAQPGADIFGRPLYLRSTEAPDHLQGDVYALVDRPYAQVREALTPPAHWCAVLILHLNVKYCRASGDPAALDVGVGRKIDQPLSEAYWVHFAYRVASAGDDFMRLTLKAPSGPLSTKDYRLVFEAAPYDAKRSVLHMGYGYGYGFAARVGMQAYLSTLGSAKVGFSVVGRNPDGSPEHVGGVRGVVERNTMRYYFAIEAYLAELALPPGQRAAQAAQDWFDLTEKYPEQLHELDRDAYLQMKQRECERERTEAPPAQGG